MKINSKENFDKFIVCISIAYILLPYIVFFFGWLKWFIAAVLGVFFVLLAVCLFRQLSKVSSEVSCRIFRGWKSLLFWAVTLLFVCIFIFYSGIGSFSFQNGDFWARNPIYRDLVNSSWPVIFDLSSESEIVKGVCGVDQVAFSYYFSWWLVPALFSKLFNSEFISNVILYLWAVLGIMLVIYNLCRKLRRISFVIPLVFVFFSGIDIIGWTLTNSQFDFTNHLEWWATYFQYSSNTTQIFWVFNQSIPVWIIVSIFLQLKSSKYSAAWCSLTFAYSPWATFGIIPFACFKAFTSKKNLKNSINVLNLVIPLFVLIVFGLFYTSSSGSSGIIGTIFNLYPNEKKLVVFTYCLFILLEFGIYFMVMWKQAIKFEYYWVTLISLLIFPFVVIRDANFTMRASIPSLFLLCYYVISFLLFKKNSNRMFVQKTLLAMCLIIGMVTPLCEINRSVVNTYPGDKFLQEEVYSLADIRTDDIVLISATKSQFFVYDYQDKIFFKYLCRTI